MREIKREDKFVLWFDEIGIDDVPIVGGKNASLGEMYQNLGKQGVKVPYGFAVTAYAYRYLLEKGGIKKEIEKILKDLNVNNLENLMRKGHEVRQLIRNTPLPKELEDEITEHYYQLCKKEKVKELDVAVRSSATAEDLPSISKDELVFIKLNNKIVCDTIENIYKKYKDQKDIEVPSMNNNKIVWSKVSDIYAHPAKNKKLYKITTETGKEIVITKDHSLIVLDTNDMKQKVVSIDDLNGKEFIPTIKQLPINKSNLKEINVLNYISKEDVEVINNNIYIKNKSNNWKIQTPLPKIINLNEEFSYFLGVFCAEGCTYKNNEVIITNSDKNIMNKIISFYKSIGIYNNSKINKNSLRIYSKTLVSFLQSVTGKPLNFKGKGRSAYIKEVPEFIYSSNSKIISSFLKGIFDGDGCVSKKGVSFCSSSKKLVYGVSILLSILDYEYYLKNTNKYFYLTIPAKCVPKYKTEISFINKNKINKLNELIKTYDLLKIHPSMKNNILISDILSKKIKEEYDLKLNKTQVCIGICPICNKSLEKTSHYKNKLRYFCKGCKKTFYENEIKFKEILKYINYDQKGKFIKGKCPWNKGVLNGSISKDKLIELFNKLNFKEYLPYFESNVLWDKIKKIEPINYTGLVYDFTVSKTENFNSGLGNIITHNSASFAGQQETYLNIKGPTELIAACRKCFASLFTNRAISYREAKKFNHFEVALSICVQRMVRSDQASSGVMFSIDTESGFKDVVLINGAYGLGENVVQGAVTPDEFYVFKPTLKEGYNAIISKTLGSKNMKMIYDTQGNKQVKNVAVDLTRRNQFCVTDSQILQLAKWAVIIEDYYSKKASHYKPMDMEWAIDGITNELFIVQARPETVQSQKNRNQYVTYNLKTKAPEPLVVGKSIGQKMVSGKVNIIRDVKDIHQFKKDEILVTEMTDPDWEPIMKIASGIVTNRGGRTCHAAIIAREHGIPCIVGSLNATEKLKTGQTVTIDCSTGDNAFVYDGKVAFEKEITDISKMPETKTQITLNVGNPEQAFDLSFLPNDGVGLAREEFIINSWIKIHPLALINYNKLTDKQVKWKIDELTPNYKDKSQYFVDVLAQGIARIAAGFYPKKVILRLSDFKSDEYANLIGGKEYEPIESNPMIGWRGASRYYQGNYKEGFKLECKAIKKVREEFGLKNLEIMIPFCRTIDEAKAVISEMKKNRLEKGKDGLYVHCMCEIPSNVILADEFLDIFDGFSIGSNDLTQLILGLDRNSELLTNIYDERNPAVKKMIKEVIEIANKKKKYIGICGQAPSDYPDFALFLVENGIKSISLNPDTVVKTKLAIAELEKKANKRSTSLIRSARAVIKRPPRAIIKKNKNKK